MTLTCWNVHFDPSDCPAIVCRYPILRGEDCRIALSFSGKKLRKGNRIVVLIGLYEVFFRSSRNAFLEIEPRAPSSSSPITNHLYCFQRPGLRSSKLSRALSCGISSVERWHVSETSKFQQGAVNYGQISHVCSSVEYLAQSGVIASILKQQREEAQGTGSSVR